jgi:hypothetical protein
MATTQKKPARAPRKPGRASGSTQGGNRPQKPATGRRTARTTGPTKPNPFDDIARQVNADQEAKDREAGRDDLTPALAKSVDQVKVQRAATKPAKPARPAKPAPPPKPAKPATPPKPARPAKVQANGKPANGKSTSQFKGRSTGNVQTVAERVKELGLRVRKDADIDALAATLRATPEAVAAWLDSRRNGTPTKQPAKAKDSAKPKQQAKPPTIDVAHAWQGPVPKELPELKGASLVMRYTLNPDGEVWSELLGIQDPDGQHMPDGWRLPLDFRPHPERDGRNRVMRLKGGRDRAALQAWLVQEGIADDQ